MEKKTAKALYDLLKVLYQSRAAKDFVDAYEHEEHERRHEKQERKMTSEDFNCLLKLAEAVRQKLLPDYVIPDNVCDEKKHESPKPERNWGSKKQRAYGKLLDCALGRRTPETICDAAIALAEACKPEAVKPEVGEVYRDIFGNKYIIVAIHDSSPDGKPVKKPLVMLIYSNAKGELSSSTFFAVPLEDFMNPTFKKE